MKRLILTAIALVACAAPAFAQAPDIRGTWSVQFHSAQGTRPATMNILTEEGRLAAYINVEQMGEIAAWVTQKDSSVTMDASVQTQGGPMKIILSGTVNGETMKGSVDFGGGTAEWNATRTKAAAAQEQGGAAQDKPAATMTGTWAFEVQHSAGTSTPTVTITQTGEKLTGKYQSTYGQFELTGSVKGADFTFSVEVGTEQKVTLVYNGTLSGDTVKGSMTMGEMGEGTFTGKRK